MQKGPYLSQTRFRRPRLSPPEAFSQIPSGPDPETVSEAASHVAHALVTGAREELQGDHQDDRDCAEHAQNAAVIGDQVNLVRLVDEIGLDTIAQLWADAPAVSLGGALWRLYALRTAVERNGELWARWYRAGYDAQVARAITGVVEPPSAAELQRLTDQILTGIYSGDFATALDRAAAYCRVTSLGQAHHAESADTSQPDLARQLVLRSHRLLRTAEELDSAAAAWRAGTLD